VILSHEILVAPAVMERQFSAEDPALTALIDGPEPEAGIEEDRRLQIVLPLLDQLPAIEADMFVRHACPAWEDADGHREGVRPFTGGDMVPPPEGDQADQVLAAVAATDHG
jgi:hypothetical protein